MRATLLTLTPIADAFRSLQPGFQAGFPLLGLSKDRPSIVSAAESASRVNSEERRRSSSSALRNGNADPIRDPSSWFLTTSTAYSSTSPRPYFRPLPILGFTAFRSVANGLLAMCLPPFEAFPPPTAAQLWRRISVPARARVTGSTVSDRSDHREPCLLVLTSVAVACGFPLRAAMEAGPRGLAPSSGPLLARPFPAVRARCSLGLVRSARPPSCSPPPHRER